MAGTHFRRVRDLHLIRNDLGIEANPVQGPRAGPVGVRLFPSGDGRVAGMAAGDSGVRSRLRERLVLSGMRREVGTGGPKPPSHLRPLHPGAALQVRSDVEGMMVPPRGGSPVRARSPAGEDD